MRKALASHQGDPKVTPRVLQTNPPSGKNQTLSILAVLRGHNGLKWLAAECALACLLLEHVVAASFAIQLLAASKDD